MAKKSKNLFVRILVLVIILALVVAGIYFFSKGVTGKSVLNIETVYAPNETLQGTLSLLIKQGELVPANSVLKVNLNNNEYEFILSELVSEKTTNGNFYAEGTLISGSGEGYGVAGSSKIAEEKSEATEEASEEPSEEVAEEESAEITEETNITEETSGEVVEETQEETGEGTEEVAEEQVVSEEGSFESESSGEISSEESEGSVITGAAVSETGAEEKRFGEDYLGDVAMTLEIDLSSLEIPAEEGELTISLIYNDEEIMSVSDYLSVSDTEQEGIIPEEIANETIANITAGNETISNVTFGNVTETNVTIENVSSYALTEEELALLLSKTGDTKVKITKAEIAGDRLIIRFEIGGYWLENSYNYNGDENELKAQIELDRVKWVKNLVKQLSETEENPENVDDLIGEYDLSSNP